MNLRFEGIVPGLRRRSPPRVEPTPQQQPHTTARVLAWAHKLQQRIDHGEFEGRAELARALGFSRARISQLLDLTLLAPDIQEEVLFLKKGDLAITEWDLRWVVGAVLWAEQRQRWGELKQPMAGVDPNSTGPTTMSVVVSSRRRGPSR